MVDAKAVETGRQLSRKLESRTKPSTRNNVRLILSLLTVRPMGFVGIFSFLIFGVLIFNPAREGAETVMPLIADFLCGLEKILRGKRVINC